MEIIRGYKTELDPNNKQKSALKQHCGIARFAYNWGLKQRIDLYKNQGKSINAIEQHKQLNELKKSDFSWMYQCSKCAPQEALRNLDKAFKKFFDNIKKFKSGKKVDKVGFPKFKSKKKGLGSFRLTGAIKVDTGHIKLPVIGWVKLKEHNYLPVDNVHILSVTVSSRVDKWFVSLQVKESIQEPTETTSEIVGIDLGLNHLATCSNGVVFENPRALKNNEKKLKRLQREVSRKLRNSKNRLKAKLKLAKQHLKIFNIRKDVLHKITTSIVKTKPRVVVMETLNVKGMLRNHRLAKHIQDVSFGEFKRQMEYKCKQNRIGLQFVSQWFPSSKTCSNCGHIQDMPLSERIFKCDKCGLQIDRDMNASINLRDTVSSTGSACGDDVRLPLLEAVVCEAGIKHKSYSIDNFL